MKGRPLALPAAQHAHAHAHAHAGMHSAHARIRTHTHALTAHTHQRTHTCTQSCTAGARADGPPATRRRNRRGQCERGGAGTHSDFRLGQSTAAGSAASSVKRAYLRANRAAAPGGDRPNPDARRSDNGAAMRARGSAAADDRRRRRRRIQRRAERPQRPARQRHAQQRSAGTAANAHGGAAAGAGRTVPPRACTGRATRGAPSPSWTGCACRAPRARAARARRATIGRRADERAEATGKSPRMHAHAPACA